MHLKVSSVKWQPFCLGLNGLTWRDFPWSIEWSVNEMLLNNNWLWFYVINGSDSLNIWCNNKLTNGLTCNDNNDSLSSVGWPNTHQLEIVSHDDVIKWKHFPRYWPFVREIHRSPVNFPHKGQWRGALMFTLICAQMNGWVNNREAGDLRRYRVHYDVIVMYWGWLSLHSTDISIYIINNIAHEEKLPWAISQGNGSFGDKI